MTKEVLEVMCGKTIYKVETEQEYTTANMTDLVEYCDPNNWGGTVERIGKTAYRVEVYTD